MIMASFFFQKIYETLDLAGGQPGVKIRPRVDAAATAGVIPESALDADAALEELKSVFATDCVMPPAIWMKPEAAHLLPRGFDGWFRHGFHLLSPVSAPSAGRRDVPRQSSLSSAVPGKPSQFQKKISKNMKADF